MLTACSSSTGETSEKSSVKSQEAEIPTEETASSTENKDEEENQYYQLGTTVSTDILAFTLNDAAMAIALSDTPDDHYCAPKEYNAEEDTDNPYVAPKGHTYAAFTYTIGNLDRAKTEFHPESSLSIAYKGNIYNEVDEVAYLLLSDTVTQVVDWTGKSTTQELAAGWHGNPTLYLLLSPEESESRRGYIDMPIDVDNLQDEFTLTVTLPDSSDKANSFTYLVTEEARLKLSEENGIN